MTPPFEDTPALVPTEDGGLVVGDAVKTEHAITGREYDKDKTYQVRLRGLDRTGAVRWTRLIGDAHTRLEWFPTGSAPINLPNFEAIVRTRHTGGAYAIAFVPLPDGGIAAGLSIETSSARRAEVWKIGSDGKVEWKRKAGFSNGLNLLFTLGQDGSIAVFSDSLLLELFDRNGKQIGMIRNDRRPHRFSESLTGLRLTTGEIVLAEVDD